MEGFLPGLVKMVEERFGKKATTSFLLLVVLGISAWMAMLFWSNAAWPIYTLISRSLEGVTIERQSIWTGAISGLIGFGIILVGFVICWYLLRRLITHFVGQHIVELVRLAQRAIEEKGKGADEESGV